MKDPRTLAEAVNRTLAYAKTFDFPGTQRDIARFLHSRYKVNPKELLGIPEFYRLPIRLAISMLECQKWRAVAQAVAFFSRVPWIRSVWVTGALAAGAIKADDDLDFLIITDHNRLWLSRAIVVLLGTVLGRYRSHWLSSSRLTNRWCCNIWLEPGALALPPDRRSLYEARELVQAVPVYTRSGERAGLLLEHNPWVRDYSANGLKFARRRAAALPSGPLVFPLPAWSFLAPPINRLLWLVQRRLMAKRLTRETVQLDRAFFHPRDTRSWVRQRYETICNDQGIAPWFTTPAP